LKMNLVNISKKMKLDEWYSFIFSRFILIGG
jgi:hypothetical protein